MKTSSMRVSWLLDAIFLEITRPTPLSRWKMFVTRPEHQKECAQFYIAKLYGLVIVFKSPVNRMWITIISHKKNLRRGHGIKNIRQTSCACLGQIEL